MSDVSSTLDFDPDGRRASAEGAEYSLLAASEAPSEAHALEVETGDAAADGIWFYNHKMADPNFHTWCVITACRNDKGLFSRLLAAAASTLLILLQILILSLMVREADGARCQGAAGGLDGGPNGFASGSSNMSA